MDLASLNGFPGIGSFRGMGLFWAHCRNRDLAAFEIPTDFAPPLKGSWSTQGSSFSNLFLEMKVCRSLKFAHPVDKHKPACELNDSSPQTFGRDLAVMYSRNGGGCGSENASFCYLVSRVKIMR